MTQQQAQPPRDYGGWRRRRGIGLLGLGTAGTFTVLGVLVIVILVAAVDVAALVYVVPPVIVAGALGLARIGGQPVALAALMRLRWWYGSARQYSKYRAGVVREHSPAFTLPGVLASTALLDAEDGYGGRYGIVHDRRTGLLTATLRAIPASTWLADRFDADTWVANWGGWLASLGHVPMLRWVTVTVDTAPDPGSTLADAFAAAVDPAAPARRPRHPRQLVEAAPAAAADVDTRVSRPSTRRRPRPRRRTSPSHGRGRPHAVRAGVSARHLRGDRAGRLTRDEIAGIVRTAFDPASRGEVNRILAQARAGMAHGQLGWADAGPVGAEELPDRYRHDSGIS